MPRPSRTSMIGLVAACFVALNLFPPGAMAVVTRTSTISTYAGTGTAGFSGNGGPARRARLNKPRDTAVGPDGSVYVADTFNNRIRRIKPNGTITTVAGNGRAKYNGDRIRATRASLSLPHDVTVSRTGVVYIADSGHHRIRRVGRNGFITTIAGTGVRGSSGNGGPAARARLKNPKSVALHGGALYTSGLDSMVRRINLRTGMITRVAGTGVAGFSGDGGPARSARLHAPQRLAIDPEGNIYVADTKNSVIRRIDATTHKIRTVAGVGRTEGTRGDGGRATSALLNHPRGVALDGNSTLYIADSDNHRVRKVNLRTGIIHKVAGTGTPGYTGDRGHAASAHLDQPRGLTVTPKGNLLIAEVGNSVIRKVAG